MSKILITGGAGFIGSHLAEELSEENNVVIYDNFSSGRRDFIDGIECEVIEGDILNQKKLTESLDGVDVCYHIAADPDVKGSYHNPIENFEFDFEGTLNVLEGCRKKSVEKFVFASSSVVYGRAEMPTPETAPIKPISNYGAAKASSENYMMSYSNLYDMKCLSLRYANIIGPRLTHGIIYDFYNKLREKPNELEILGDGSQKKSYLHVKDCVDATVFATNNLEKDFEVYNVGSEEQISVNEMADVIVDELGLENVDYKYTGGGKGWPGDVPKMLLSIEKLKEKGWKPSYNIKESVADTLDYLRDQNGK